MSALVPIEKRLFVGTHGFVAALERVPASLTEASADLGATPGQTFRKVILPLAIPGVRLEHERADPALELRDARDRAVHADALPDP